MKWLRVLAILVVALDFLDPVSGPVFWSETAAAQPIPSIFGPQDPATMNEKLNVVIRNVNAILMPLTGGPATPAAGSNLISLSPGKPGSPAVIGLQTGGDANGGIQISPNGSGSIVLFGSGTTGVLQFGNQASFVSFPSVNAYVTVPPLAAIQGVKSTVQGMFIVKDWLGKVHGIASY